MKPLLSIAILLISQVAFAQSGITWQPSMPVASSNVGNQHPRVTVDAAGNPLILWGRSDASRVYLSRWTGAAFSSPFIVNGTIPVFAASWAGPDLAAHGDTVYVVFKETPEDVNHIYLVHSYNGGIDFSAPVQVDSIDGYLSRFPAVTVDSVGNPIIAFMKFDAGFQNARYVVVRSNDFGQDFTADVPASGFSGGDACDCCPATVVASGNRVATLYRDNLSNLRNMWAGLSTDGGNTFSEGIQVDNTNWMVNACPSSGPDGVIVGDSLYTVFMSAAGGLTRCYWSRSSLSTQQAGPSVPVTGSIPGLSQQNFPRIANDGAFAAMVWRQTVSNAGQLALRFTNDISQGFSAGYDTVALGAIANGDVALWNGNAHVVWEDENSGQVYYRKGIYATSGIHTPEQALPTMTIYPNPMSGNALSVFFSKKLSGRAAYSISNIAGQVLITDSGTIENGVLTIEAALPDNGIYLLRVNFGTQSFIGKAVR